MTEIVFLICHKKYFAAASAWFRTRSFHLCTFLQTISLDTP